MERRQAVHKEHVAVLSFAEHVHSDLVRREQLDALRDLVLLAHGSPDIGVYDISALQNVYIVLYLDRCSSLLAYSLYLSYDLCVYVVYELLRAVSDEMHAHLCAAVHPRAAHVVSNVADECNSTLVKRFCDVLLDSEHVGEYLSRVVLVSKAVPYRHA